MARVKQNNSASAPEKTPKFNIKRRYNKLNNDQKQLLMEQYILTFNKQWRSLYNLIKRDNLTDEELHFFASIFEVPIVALYTNPPMRVPSLYELERKSEGTMPALQARLEV